jgi:hypothetical protein
MAGNSPEETVALVRLGLHPGFETALAVAREREGIEE